MVCAAAVRAAVKRRIAVVTTRAESTLSVIFQATLLLGRRKIDATAGGWR